MSKELEMRHLVREALGQAGYVLSEAQSQALLDEFISITPGSTSVNLNAHTEFITLTGRGGAGGGVTIKPGNIRLSLRKLAVALAGGVMTVAAIGSPILAFCGALIIWDSVYSMAKAEISPRLAGVIWTMWRHRKTPSNTIPKDGLLALVNEEMRRYGEPELTENQFGAAIKQLGELSCIQQCKSDPSSWWLREWVQVDY